MEMVEYLKKHFEKCPEWLIKHKKGDKFNRVGFFESRVVFYPGHGSDGHPIRIFGKAHAAHCYVFADYLMTKDEVAKDLESPTEGFKGYSKLDRIDLSERDLVPNGWQPSARADGVSNSFGSIKSYGFLEIMERKEDFDDSHGPHRLAVLFLGADGVATYDALFCQITSPMPPYAVLLQDHGSGGNHNKFGAGGLLEEIAISSNVFPEMLVAGISNTRVWKDYEQVPSVNFSVGGMHANKRFLFKKCEQLGSYDNAASSS